MCFAKFASMTVKQINFNVLDSALSSQQKYGERLFIF